MKKTFVVALLLVGVLTLFGCSKNAGLVGKWAYGNYVYTFNEDKTCSYDASGTKMECTYEVDGDKLSILYKGNTAPFETTYKIDGNTLTIKDSFGSDVKYTRK